MIQKLQEDAAGVEDAAPVAYFYCLRENTESCRVDVTENLRAILKQLSCSSPDGQVRHTIAAEYKQRLLDAERGGLDVRSLAPSECTHLILELTSEAPATIVIDGVDELSSTSQDLLSALQRLVDKSSSVLKVFVSSREEAAIARSLHHASSIRVTSADNSKDVTAFVNHHVSNAIEQKRLLGGLVSNSLREDIISETIDGTGEMFLWASLQLQHLCTGRIFKHSCSLNRDHGGKLGATYRRLEHCLCLGELFGWDGRCRCSLEAFVTHRHEEDRITIYFDQQCFGGEVMKD